MKKPKLRSLIIATLKDTNKEIYLDYRYEICEYKNSLKPCKYLYPHFPREYNDKFNISWKNIKSWKYVFDENNRQEYFKYKSYWQWYWTKYSEDLQIQNPSGDADKLFNDWITDLKHIEFLEEWISGLGFYDGEIENPSFAVSLIFKSGILKLCRALNIDSKNIK